ncbi:MAG: hypothetical protein SCARUB_02764 [Candidatus Scalindua rubra]|uniref:Uncharacterized protein n=1 Tax=Candidatus Scalindua rubra TaxID=1872076 RepID=A0A1E3XAX3_9BACT|nr:MAG: hypothetical protein SCARUB_02764 [Candidatus Scalindua rubra]
MSKTIMIVPNSIGAVPIFIKKLLTNILTGGEPKCMT